LPSKPGDDMYVSAGLTICSHNSQTCVYIKSY